MKTIRTLFVCLTLIVSVTTAIKVSAQHQSLFLPVPGTYSSGSTDYDGCKVINFSNSGNPGISNLPRHPFQYLIQTGEPHNETHLAGADPSMNEYYLGQHPAFAQSLVHDPYGNLLFFIVDNNIYNRHGVAFPKKTFPEDAPGPGYAYLHDGEVYFIELPGDDLIANVYSGSVLGSDINRFSMAISEISLDPEIAIFPIEFGQNCYKYGLSSVRL